jgi:hypothetical protein
MSDFDEPNFCGEEEEFDSEDLDDPALGDVDAEHGIDLGSDYEYTDGSDYDMSDDFDSSEDGIPHLAVESPDILKLTYARCDPFRHW